MDLYRLELRRLRSAEGEEIGHDLVEPLGLGVDDLEQLVVLTSQGGIGAKHLHTVADCAQRVTCLVGDGRRDLADGGHAGLMDELLLGGDDLGIGRFELLVEARVLHGDGRLARHALEKIDVFG